MKINDREMHWRLCFWNFFFRYILNCVILNSFYMQPLSIVEKVFITGIFYETLVAGHAAGYACIFLSSYLRCTGLECQANSTTLHLLCSVHKYPYLAKRCHHIFMSPPWSFCFHLLVPPRPHLYIASRLAFIFLTFIQASYIHRWTLGIDFRLEDFADFNSKVALVTEIPTFLGSCLNSLICPKVTWGKAQFVWNHVQKLTWNRDKMLLISHVFCFYFPIDLIHDEKQWMS